MNFNGIDGILRTGGIVTAGRGREGRDGVFIDIHRNRQYPS